MRHRSSHETSTKTPVIILPFREASHVKLAHSSRIISHISHILSHHNTYKVSSQIQTCNLQRQHQLPQLLEIRKSQSRHWIPSDRSIPMRPRDNARARNSLITLRINAIAPDRLSRRDIRQRLVPLAVQQGVQETKRGLARPQTSIVQHAH